MLSELIYIIISLAILANIVLIIFFLLKVKSSPDRNLSNKIKVSVVIAVKNEKDNINFLLDSLKNQTCQKEYYEIIIVDDFSSDDTLASVIEKSLEFSNLLVMSNKNNPLSSSGKKSALQFGISKSSGEIILLTDADCIPGNKWIETIVNTFDETTDAVIGYSPFIQENTLLNKFICYENLKTSFLMKSFFSLGMPYMCFGRNFAYRKSVFYEAGEFEKINHSLSGDDDLFLQVIHKLGKKIKFCDDRESLVYTKSAKNFRDYFRKSVRHLSAGKYYSLKMKMFLGFYYLSSLLMTLTFIAGLFLPLGQILTMLLFLLIILSFQAYLANRAIRSNLVFIEMPLLELFLNLYNFFAGILSLRKKIKW